MMNKYIIHFILLFLPFYSTYAQQNSNVFKGVFLGQTGQPLEVVTVTIANREDNQKYLFLDTFTGGNFEISFQEDNGKEYDVTVMSFGYEDLHIGLNELKGNLVLKSRSIHLDDVIVKGKRDVKVNIGEQGGIIYDVGNTYLSDMGTSTELLNYIPGLDVSKKGDIKVLASEGDVKIYMNDIPLQENQKLLTLKSEDIASVEVIRSPGAKYKNAGAVILIKTRKTLNGFSTQVSLNTTVDWEGEMNWGPLVDLSYAKNKISVSVAYQYNNDNWRSVYFVDRKISPESFPGNWRFTDNENLNTRENKHWYNGVVQYEISDRHKLTLEYSGSHASGKSVSNSMQNIFKESEETYENLLDKINDKSLNQNKLHLFYYGGLTNNLNLACNLDYSNLITSNLYLNHWNETDQILSTQKDVEFNQDIQSTANAYTFDFIFDHALGKKHSLNYGAEISSINEDVVNTISNNTYPNSDYSLKSSFIKAIFEYNVLIREKLSLNIGLNYMYSYLNDNLSTLGKNNYHSVIPYLSMTYRNKDYSVRGSFRYFNNQPTAGYLDESTVTVNSPYEITRGNRNLINAISTTANLYFSYKGFGVGFMHQYKKQAFTSSQIVEDNEEFPLIVNTYNNYKKPFNDVYLYVDYMKEISFWTLSVYANLKYTWGNIEQQRNVFHKIRGVSSQISLKNRFKLPKNFYLQLDGSYRTRGYMMAHFLEPMYSLNFTAEKQFLDNKLNIKLFAWGLICNKYQKNSVEVFGINTYSKSYNSFNRGVELSLVWRFNNYKQVQRTKDNEYLKMLE